MKAYLSMNAHKPIKVVKKSMLWTIKDRKTQLIFIIINPVRRITDLLYPTKMVNSAIQKPYIHNWNISLIVPLCIQHFPDKIPKYLQYLQYMHHIWYEDHPDYQIKIDFRPFYELWSPNFERLCGSFWSVFWWIWSFLRPFWSFLKTLKILCLRIYDGSDDHLYDLHFGLWSNQENQPFGK